MDRHLVLVMSNPVEGREAEFHEWYENTHLDEVLSTCGWKSAERFTLSAQRGANCGFTHIAVYDAEASDAESLVETLNATRGQRRQSGAIDLRSAGLWIFSPAGKRHYHPEHT